MTQTSLTIKFKFHTIVIYILFVLCLLGCNTVYSTCVNANYRIPELTILFLFLLLLIDLRYLTKKVIKKWLIVFIPYYLWNFIIILVSVPSYKIISYSVKFLIFLPVLSLIILGYARKNNIWKIALQFENVVLIYSIVSLVMWILVGLFNVIPSSGEIIASWGGERIYPLYYGIFTTRQTQEFLGITWIRNQGFFTEGPMYNLVLQIAICIEAFIGPLNDRKQKYIWNGIDLRKMFILIITDITTFTITGMILLVIISAFKYYLMSNNSMLVKLLKWIGAILVLIIVLIIVNNLFAIKSGTGSWEVRFDDFLAGYKAWKDNILFGNGYDTMDAINWHMSTIRAYNTGYSSGIFSILAQGGIFLIINYIIGFIGYIKYSISLHRFELCAMIIIIFIILVTSIFQYTFIMMIILAYGYALLTLEIAKSLRK